jgi:glycosyltransferase involved in cell wall biosynthesis
MNSVHEPLVSIIIPAFNREHLIGETLDSVLAQTYQYWECIVVDDGSTDGTRGRIKGYADKDKRVHLCANERKKGAQGARNTGINYSEGDYVIFFDSDNYMYPTLLESMINQLLSTDSDICTCFIKIIDNDSKKNIETNEFVCNGNIHSYLLMGKCYIDNNNALIKKCLIEKIGLLDENCPSHQEKDTHIRLSRISKYTTVQKFLVNYYTGASDTISADRKKEIEGHLYILSKYKFYWRYKFYRGFINSAKRIRKIISSNTQSNSFRYIMKLYLIAPELILLSIINTIKERMKQTKYGY